MVSSQTFLYLGLAFIPSLFYIFLIHLTAPYGSIKIRKSFEYLFAGFSSVFFLSLIFTFTNWHTEGLNPFYDYFIVVAPREELVKFISFMVVTFFTIKIKDKKEHPIGVMFYFGVVGLGFAMIENVQYAHVFGGKVIMVRFLTSTLAHMLFGLLFGYWVALSEIDCSKFKDRSLFGVLTHKYKLFKFYVYTMIGYISSVVYHGLWDYNIETSGDSYMTIMIMMLFFGILGVHFAMKNLNDSYRSSLK
jgi:RsiW-degrading membrane proteinase PrsW (M82 family)